MNAGSQRDVHARTALRPMPLQPLSPKIALMPATIEDSIRSMTGALDSVRIKGIATRDTYSH